MAWRKLVKVKGSDKLQKKAIQAYALTYEDERTNRARILIKAILRKFDLDGNKFGYEDNVWIDNPPFLFPKIEVDQEKIGAELVFLSN